MSDARLAQARRWRQKAEELRTATDQMQYPFSRQSLARMAATYDPLILDAIAGATLTGTDLAEADLDRTALKNVVGLKEANGLDRARNREKAVH